MTSYAIGDIQGCFQTFIALLQLINFRPEHDHLLIAGDLVNRGPDSLAVLRWMKDHDGVVTAVLGNHDLHLLARAAHVAEPKKRDTLDELLGASDRDALLTWLASRPLIHQSGAYTLLHAGLLPQWSLSLALDLSRSIEAALRAGRMAQLYLAGRLHKQLYWSPAMTGDERLGCALRVMTNVRMIEQSGQAAADFSDAPQAAPFGLTPWYAARMQQNQEPHFLFGHWSALGYYRAPQATCLDSGCVWGQTLTALRLSDGQVFQQANAERVLH